MVQDILLRCACGSVRGRAADVSAARGNRLVCLCDDCQAYAHWLEQAERVLDGDGGTEVFQLTPAQLTLTTGHDQVRCVRLSTKGLLRWYAGCCRTPIANTLASSAMPFAGVVHTFIDLGDDEALDRLGPVLARVQGRFAPRGVPPGAHARAPLSLIVRSVRQLAAGWWAKAHRPSPFFDDAGQPVVTPTVVAANEREALRARCGPQ